MFLVQVANMFGASFSHIFDKQVCGGQHKYFCHG